MSTSDTPTPDPTFPPEAYMLASDVVRSIGQNLAIQYQTEGETWDRDAMQKHMKSRAAILHVAGLLLDEAGRVMKEGR